MPTNNRKQLKPKKQAPLIGIQQFDQMPKEVQTEPTTSPIPIEEPQQVDQPNLNPIANAPIPMGDPAVPAQPDNVHGRYGKVIKNLRSKMAAKTGISFDKPKQETKKGNLGLDSHFWYNINTGESHDVDDNAAYHVQHVIKNPSLYGYKDDKDLQQHTKNSIAQLRKGNPDVDYDLEHHVMEKGFARGYHNRDSRNVNSERSWTRLDVSSEEHKNKFLAKVLPHLKKVAPNGAIAISVGKRGAGQRQKEYDFRNAAEAEKHLQGIAPQKPVVADAPRPTIVPGKPLSSDERDTMRKKFKGLYPNKSKTQIDREVQGVSGVWGDSVEPPTSFGTFFSEMIKRIKK